MDFGVLINAVEGHVCLYDKSDKNYKNNLNKEKAWDEISEIVGMPKEDCKKKWNYLREKFNKENKKSDLPSGCEAPFDDEWPYMHSLMFLKQFIQPRKTKSNNFGASFELSDEPETTKGDETMVEPHTAKRQKPDPFVDTYLMLKEIMVEFSERHRAQKPAETADDQFFKTTRLLYDDIPSTVKETARLDILGYITILRAVHLNNYDRVAF